MRMSVLHLKYMLHLLVRTTIALTIGPNIHTTSDIAAGVNIPTYVDYRFST